MHDPLMTVEDMARELQVHMMTVYRLCKQKVLPAFKVGGRWRMRREDFDHLGEQVDAIRQAS